MNELVIMETGQTAEETITIPIEALRYALHDLYRSGIKHVIKFITDGTGLDEIYLCERQIDYMKSHPNEVPPEILRDYPLDLTPITEKFFAKYNGVVGVDNTQNGDTH